MTQIPDIKEMNKPILIVDKLSKNFGNHKDIKEKITKNEEILLTLIANTIVQIILSEELWML